MDNHPDIIIVGAGAAGLSAAVRLSNEPVSVVVLEARDRIGGRAWTREVKGFPQDMGCGWLHSADVNPFSGIAEQLGFEVDRTPPHWTRQAWNQNFTAEDQAAYRQAMEVLEDRVVQAARRGEDRPVSGLMDPENRWNPLLNAFSGYYNGAGFGEISTLDYDAYQDTEINWRLPAGYGALVAAFGAPAAVSLDTPVTRIDHSGPRIQVETPRGSLSASAVIITLPTDLIAKGSVAFSPPLPDVQKAARELPLGAANKVVLALDDAEAFPAEQHLFGDPSSAETGSYHLRPFGRPLIEGFFGGAHARAMEADGDGAATAFAIQELANLLGSDMRRRLHGVAETRWASDPWSGGSYSHAAPGCAGARAVLARPVDGRIFFAGEACSPHAFSTAHGAAESGAAAASAALVSVTTGKPGA